MKKGRQTTNHGQERGLVCGLSSVGGGRPSAVGGRPSAVVRRRSSRM
ncbi:MAG: hypothetical protein KIT52_03200 [Anaerolineae bacterium]|nr:hypothetical protein [Anaerolineae bacterium]